MRVRQKLTDCTGQSLVELALVLPLLLVLLVGVIDLSRAIQAHNSIVNMSREGANLASRSQLMNDEEQGADLIMNSLANTSGSLAMATNGMMYLTKVQGEGGSPSMKSQFAWKQNKNGPKSAVGPDTVAQILGTIKLNEGDTVWIFEVFYKYQSMFAESYAPQLHTVAIFSGGSR